MICKIILNIVEIRLFQRSRMCIVCKECQVFKKLDSPVLNGFGLGVTLFKFKGDAIGETVKVPLVLKLMALI